MELEIVPAEPVALMAPIGADPEEERLLRLFFLAKKARSELTAKEYLFAVRDILTWRNVKLTSFGDLRLADFEEYQTYLLTSKDGGGAGYATNTAAK